MAGTLSGITVPAAQRNLRVYNGSVDYWYASGLRCDLSSNSQFDHLRVSQNNGNGLVCGNGSVLNGCSAEANGFEGLQTGDRSTLTGCTAANNGADGIVTGTSSTLTFCTSTGNLSPYAGFAIDQDCTIIGCSAVSNYYGIYSSSGCTIKECTANRNSKNGITGSSALLIVNCTACYNSGDGIACASDCLINVNTASYNVNGIHVPPLARSTGLMATPPITTATWASSGRTIS